VQSSVFGCNQQLTDGTKRGVCAQEKRWQWASFCHPLAAQQLMTLMTTTTSQPHTDKAAAAMAMASLYSDSGGSQQLSLLILGACCGNDITLRWQRQLGTAVTAHMGWDLIYSIAVQWHCCSTHFWTRNPSGSALSPVAKNKNGKATINWWNNQLAARDSISCSISCRKV